MVQGNTCIGSGCTTTDATIPALKLKGPDVDILFDDQDIPKAAVAYTRKWALLVDSPERISSVSSTSMAARRRSGSAAVRQDNSVSIASNGNLGLGTSTPAQDIHVMSGNTPALRLDQDGSESLTARTWDVGANDTKFFVRDVTGSSSEPLRIQAGAPTSSIEVASSGKVGIGTASPSESSTSSATTEPPKRSSRRPAVRPAREKLLSCRNNGGPVLIFEDTSVPQRWANGSFGSSFIIDEQADSGLELVLTNTGNLTISGTLTQNSDRNTKRDLLPVSGDEVLRGWPDCPFSTWNLKTDDPAVRHMGPMAQDFSAVFGLGEDERHIAPLDVAGVSLAALQALDGKLAKVVTDKDAELAQLRRRDAHLDERLAALEALVSAMAEKRVAATIVKRPASPPAVAGAVTAPMPA